jgi:hypothetical protein
MPAGAQLVTLILEDGSYLLIKLSQEQSQNPVTPAASTSPP